MFRQCVIRSTVAVRQVQTSAPMAAGATDPIQQIFLDKLKDYSSKSKAAGGKMVNVTAETEKSLISELDRVARTFRIKDENDAKSFPKFTYQDPEIQPLEPSAK